MGSVHIKSIGMNYTESLTNYKRRMTHTVNVGGIPMGSDFPVRIQSMANTSTAAIKASVEQCISMINAGAEYVRFTVPSLKDVENLRLIQKELDIRMYAVPLIADVHFNPAIALKAAEVVAKVRINPGNYGTAGSETDDFVVAEAEFRKLIDICRKNHTAVRIGVNHGSLSRRMVMKYGDTPRGMAESAMEFLCICRSEGFDQVVVSMKSSNVLVMVQSTRLLAAMMKEAGMTFPLHLGVTEAGEGEDGRIKSACGIGALLADGIGDTIRVSLTEDPAAELPVAGKLADHFREISGHEPMDEPAVTFISPYEQKKRIAVTVVNIGGGKVPVVVASAGSPVSDASQLAGYGWHYEAETKTWRFEDDAADYIFAPGIDANIVLPMSKVIILPYDEWVKSKPEGTCPLSHGKDMPQAGAAVHFISVTGPELPEVAAKIKSQSNVVLVYNCGSINVTGELKMAFYVLHNIGCRAPVVIRLQYSEGETEDFQLKAAADLGCTLIDGFGDGLWLTNNCADSSLPQVSGLTEKQSLLPQVSRLVGPQSPPLPSHPVRTAFAILQACRARIFKTEYISCPSCGRTHFDLITTLARIKARTSHLKGLKIGVMGCIVNGPGEMADADYGYVGAGRGRITLYRSKEVIKRNIPEEEAVDELIELIKQNGDWMDPV